MHDRNLLYSEPSGQLSLPCFRQENNCISNLVQLFSTLRYTWWRLLFAVAAVILSGFELYKHLSSFYYMSKAIARWKAFREKSLRHDQRFCHPKWRDENEYLDKEIKDARDERFFSRQDGWIFLDWIALLLVLSGITSHLVFLVIGSRFSRDIHVRIVSFELIVIYIRLLKFTRPFEGKKMYLKILSQSDKL